MTETNWFGVESGEDRDERPDVAVDDVELDHLCWVMVESLDNWWPPDDTATQCLDDEAGDTDVAWERGYHTGALAMTEDYINKFRLWLDIDVLARAERYRRANGLPEFEFTDEYLRHGDHYAFGETAVENYLERREARQVEPEPDAE